MDSYDIAVAAAKNMDWPKHTPKTYEAGRPLFEHGAVFYENYVEVFDAKCGNSTMMSKRKFTSFK